MSGVDSNEKNYVCALYANCGDFNGFAVRSAYDICTRSKERVVRYFSYFSMVPVGYGNWFPIITAFLSVIIVLLLLAGMKKVNTGNTVEILLIICIISQLLLWLLFNSVSAVGVCVMVLHIIVFILQMFQKRKLGK